jgi:hypothetical protein
VKSLGFRGTERLDHTLESITPCVKRQAER